MRNLDLNLLMVFDAIVRERNVLRASEAISLSPSAVSHALGRLRVLLKDELFVRTVAGMEPTVRALEMAPLVRDALVMIAAIVPATLAMFFRQSGSAYPSELPWKSPRVLFKWCGMNAIHDPGHEWLRIMLKNAAQLVNDVDS